MNKEVFSYIMPSIKNRSLKYVDGKKDFNFRLEMARIQAEKEPVDQEVLIRYVNEFLEMLGMEVVENPRVEVRGGETHRINYSSITTRLTNKDDIVWIKFTDDNFISVIGTSRDIYFSEKAKNNTSSGIINQKLNKDWDEKEVLIFPLINIPDGLYRSDVECGIGNYLISKGVPILDYYSHIY